MVTIEPVSINPELWEYWDLKITSENCPFQVLKAAFTGRNFFSTESYLTLSEQNNFYFYKESRKKWKLSEVAYFNLAKYSYYIAARVGSI